MKSLNKSLIVALSLSAALTLTACGAGSGATESSKGGKSVATGKRGAESNSLEVADGEDSSAVCDAGVIVPKLPDDEIVPKLPSDDIDPKLPDDEIIPKLPECGQEDDTITPRQSDDHGCLADAICVYKEPNFSGPFATLDVYKASSIAIQFPSDTGFTSGYSLFSDGTPTGDEISSIVNNSNMDATFYTDAEWEGGKIQVDSHSDNSNLSEWGVNDVITSMEATKKKQK